MKVRVGTVKLFLSLYTVCILIAAVFFACYFTSDLSQCCKSQKGNKKLLFSLCTSIALACYSFGLILRSLFMQFFQPYQSSPLI